MMDLYLIDLWIVLTVNDCYPKFESLKSFVSLTYYSPSYC